jgi:hypothetical protein
VIRRLTILSLFLAAAAPAAAPADPAISPPARSARIESLAARALAAFDALPAEKQPEAANYLVNDFVMLGRCPLADPLLRAHSYAARSIAILAHPQMLDRDPACADRLIAFYAQPNPAGLPRRDARTLYTAGALWQRIGQRDKAEAAIDEAERELAEQEASNPVDEWSCHGGNCLSGLWSTRLWALGLTRGTPRHRVMLRWAATLALSHAAARDAHRPGPFIGQAVFEELLPLAFDAGDDKLARLLAEHTTYGYEAASAGHRMRRLFEQDRIAEALELWPAAGTAFQARITPALLRANLPLFHRWREQLRNRHWRGPAELHSLLASAWIERGEPERAREALASARAHHASVKGHDWDLEYVRRLQAVEAMLEGGRDPVGWLRRRSSAPRGPSLENDYGFRELAAVLAATGRQTETRRAVAEIRDLRIRRSFLVELPCRAAHGGGSAAVLAVAVARGNLRAGGRDEEKESGFANDAFQTFVCLVRAHRGEAAIAYARAIEDPDVRLTLLTAMPADSGIPNEAALRRRLANLAFALVEARGLWADERVPSIAADFERAGDFTRVERVLARVRGSEGRMEVLSQLLRVYAPGPT